MKILRKKWTRALLSVVVAAMTSQLIQSEYGEMPQKIATPFLWIASIFIFIILSIFNRLLTKNIRKKDIDIDHDILDKT